jgi:hypothetical protein
VALKALTLHSEASNRCTGSLSNTRGLDYLGPGALQILTVELSQARINRPFVPSHKHCTKRGDTPGVVMRDLMVFRGVRPDDVGIWASAAARATAVEGATSLTKLVGVDAMRAPDRMLSCVLELRGTEVE